MTPPRPATVLVLLAGAALAAVALLARQRTYVGPRASAPDSIPLAIEEPAPAGYVVRSFDVEGICCQGCSSKLYGALLAVEGVRAAAVDPLRKRASALVREEVEPARLVSALTFDKYSARPH